MKKNKIILLSGTPASGKDALTRLLILNNSHFCHFKKHKIDGGGKRDDSYHLINSEEFSVMSERGDFLQHHSRYGRGYGVSYKQLQQNWSDNKIPIVHVGRYENMAPFMESGKIDVFSILLLTSLEETTRRLQERHADNADEVRGRLQAYTEERIELSNRISSGSALHYSCMIDNTKLSLDDLSRLVLNAIKDWGYSE